jgi:hypothetical protein
VRAASDPFARVRGGSGLAASDHASSAALRRAQPWPSSSIRHVSARDGRTLRRVLEDAGLAMALSEPLVHAAYYTHP